MKHKTKVWDGEVISEPGIYSNVPLDVYHSQNICAGPSVSSSGLRRVLEENNGSPAHFYAEWSGNPERIEVEKEAYIFGRACHHYLLGQPDFAKHFVIRPDELPDAHGVIVAWQSNKTICRDWVTQAGRGGACWDQRKLKWVKDPAQGPLTVIKGEDVVNMMGVARALGSHPIVRQGILNGDIERSMFWRDKKTGIWLKSRPDAVPTASGDFSDLKTTTSVQWNELSRTIGSYAYHQQAALVSEAARECADLATASFSFVFVEKKPPYCVRVVMLKAEHIALGAVQNRRALDLIARCIKAKKWPGPGDDDIVHVDLPKYYFDNAALACEAAKVEDAA